MNILFFIPSFLVFIYCLYKLAKDDYVFLRKNVSTEQIVDMAFLTLWIGLIISRIFFMIVHPVVNQNVFLSFFSLRVDDFSALSFFLGSSIGLYLIGRYKKLPLERLFDIFTISFSVALPVALLTHMVSLRDYPLLISFINALFFGVFSYILIKYISSKYIIFSLVFLILSLGDSLVMQFLNHTSYVTVENVVIVITFVISLGFFVKQKLIKK